MNEEEKGFEEELASKFITGLIMTSETIRPVRDRTFFLDFVH